MRISIILFLITIFCPFSLPAKAVLHLNNGDVISGEITCETSDSVSLLTEAMGVVTVDKAFIEPGSEPDTGSGEKGWERTASIGYSSTTGNIRDSSFSGEFSAHKKSDKDEKELKADFEYASSDRKMDTQSWYAMARYGKSFADHSRWYYFEKLEADHDKFTNINYRVIPSAGTGYWFSDSEDLKTFAECGLGFSHTDHTDNSKDSNELILVPRFFYQKRLWQETVFIQDITLYPSLEDADECRLHSETSLINPINDTLALKLSLIDDYDSEPGPGIKKNDMKFISSLVYSF